MAHHSLPNRGRPSHLQRGLLDPAHAESTGTSAQLHPISAERSLNEVMREGRGGGLDPQDNSQFILQHFNSFSMTIQKLAMQGKHNLFNSMAAE